MPRTPKAPTAPPPCRHCQAPSTELVGIVPFCERCAPMARDLGKQAAKVIVQSLRQLKAEYVEEGRAA